MTMNYQKICGLAVLGLVCFGTDCQAVECTQAPDCATLGYTQTVSECGEEYLACPFNKSAVLCIKNNVSCAIGSVLADDQLCYEAGNFPASRTPIAIVFDSGARLALALTDVKKDGSSGNEKMLWASQYCDIPNLENCAGDGGADTAVRTVCGIDGRNNTNAILAVNGGCMGTTYVVNAVNAYEPKGCTKDFCKKGKWFLPSMKEFVQLFSVYDKSLVLTLNSLASRGAETMQYGYGDDTYYWTSTEGCCGGSWYSNLKGYINDGSKYSDKTSYQYNVRPIIKY